MMFYISMVSVVTSFPFLIVLISALSLPLSLFFFLAQVLTNLFIFQRTNFSFDPFIVYFISVYFYSDLYDFLLLLPLNFVYSSSPVTLGIRLDCFRFFLFPEVRLYCCGLPP